MRDYIELGPTPCEEDCVQVGTEDYAAKARPECQRYIALIRATCGEEPYGAHLTVKSFPHDFGSYLEVVCYYDDSEPEAVAYAWNLEKSAPARWAD